MRPHTEHMVRSVLYPIYIGRRIFFAAVGAILIVAIFVLAGGLIVSVDRYLRTGSIADPVAVHGDAK